MFKICCTLYLHFSMLRILHRYTGVVFREAKKLFPLAFECVNEHKIAEKSVIGKL